MANQTDERPVETPKLEERVAHRYCHCQQVEGRWEPPMTALCGHVRHAAPTVVSRAGELPDDCIVCRGLHAAHVRCRLCSRVPR